MHASKWFLITRPKPKAQYRLFCFPYAGGSATAYMAWEDLLPDNIELVAIQPPGRANRLSEGLLTSVDDMAGQIARFIPQWLDRPYMMYGHSLGAAVSFELLHVLKEKNLPMPFRYFCGARRAPHYSPRIPPIHNYPLDKFKSELKSLNGTPEIILNNADLMEIFVPILRTDFKAAYIYHRAPDVKLDCAVSIFGGALDDKVTKEDLVGWQDHFQKKADFRVFDGGHFFMDENKDLVLNAICEGMQTTSPDSALCA
ncbi:thioesterase II family protein [Undibacterium sp. TJN19]|uniref:thioesterase II family protein n=1 Tax=Undibacterium sp. TJN19 TaxID=3413055 RepID=UPI003BF2529B